MSWLSITDVYVAAHQSEARRIATNVAKLAELLSAKSERVSKGYLSLVIAATLLGKFNCQFEQRLGFV